MVPGHVPQPLGLSEFRGSFLQYDPATLPGNQKPKFILLVLQVSVEFHVKGRRRQSLLSLEAT